MHSETELECARRSCLACTKCELSRLRINAVFGTGCIDRPPIAFVGEAPGEKEDQQGVPFVGKAGQLLDKMIASINYARDQVYILNCVCCRPPANRKPTLAEIAACSPFLVRQLRAVRPRTIVLLGATAAETLLGKKSTKLSSLRGKWFTWCDIPTRVTYHPAFLLRQPDKKNEAFEDLKAVEAKIKERASR